MSEQAARDADVALVLAFLNTVDVEEDTDVLRDKGSWQAWAGERDLEAGPLPAARAAREALRAWAAGEPFPEATGATVRIELTGDGPALVASTAVSAVLAAATRLTVLGEGHRIKICPADDCRWAFYDQSRNHSRTWCSMRVCGNREKARAWRERSARTQP
ncbi:CGNR zinc finger domain-containing protein [Amycolatopsis anabasis]|uniref:CGNR zinc finger domain-containing protein n=1 Tax=Amycolatopsis anabasis TaxID=1840409 RepID=UPI00131CADD5|nr:CGNR zinc finger domain-containing protein [Amycolatopsis anabasis]